MTPLTPTDWKMTFDGETVSLWPSIGNWQLACRSHYVIDRGRVVQAGAWSKKQVVAEQARDKRAKASYYGTSEQTGNAPAPVAPITGKGGSPRDDARPKAQRVPKKKGLAELLGLRRDRK